MKSEKVKEIKKALECCANWNSQESCNDCAIGVEKCFEDENLMPRLTLTLINELESENKQRKDFISELRKENAKNANCLKQFAERLKEKAKEIVTAETVDVLVKLLRFSDELVKEFSNENGKF